MKVSIVLGTEYNTERSETLEIGSNMPAGIGPHEIIENAKLMLNRRNNWQNPFSDSKAGERIVHTLKKKFSFSYART